MTGSIAPKSQSATLVPATVIFIGSLVLLFARLGHYPMWDDEAITAMTARAVWQTGDTSARVDEHNYLVYRNGLLVRNLKDRYTSPLQFYLIAPFIGLLGDGNFACRLPFALCGVITVCFLLLWLRKLNPPPLVWWAAAVILLTNAEFFLFFRQCRYYGLAMMLTTAVAFFYCNRDGRLRWSIALSISLAALLSAQYLDYGGAVACLIVDYALWGRKKPIKLPGWLIILLPQLIVGGVVLSIWNLALAGEHAGNAGPSHWMHDRLFLFWWNWRDTLRCDFAIPLLVLACPLLFLKRRSPWQLRAPMALAVFVTALAFAVPTALVAANAAEVRYLAPAIPLGMGVGIVAVWGLLFIKPLLRQLVLVLASASILIEWTPEQVPPLMHSTALLYYHELIHPQTESYTPVIDWINRNVPPGASIFVQPAYKAYPLMLRASKAIYAWQLDDREEVFTPVNPARGEMPTLEIFDPEGKKIAQISVTNGNHPDAYTVAHALIDAWNGDENASAIAVARGNTSVMLVPQPGAPAVKVVPSVRDAKTGTIVRSQIEPRADFHGLSDIHYFGRIAPDYMIRFGTNGESADFQHAIQLLKARGITYRLVDTIHLHWKDYFRPERIWHSFVTVEPKAGDEINIYKRR